MKYIPLTKGAIAIVDDEDYEELNRYKWHSGCKGYAIRRRNGKDILMHRVLLNLGPHLMTDHINGNRVDNRRANLRPCTKHQNLFNQGKQLRKTSSRFKGVTLESGKWRVRIALDGKRINLGVYNSEIDAGQAYNNAAIRLYSGFARLNLVV